MIRKKVHMVKPEILEFVEWMFKPENRVFAKNGLATHISDFYKRQTGKQISHVSVAHNRNKWIKLNGRFYDKKEIPIDIFTSEKFKIFAMENGIEVDDGFATTR